MPRQRRVPGYRLHKPSNLAFFEIRGRRQYLGRYDTDESRERYYKLIAESFALTSQPRRIERPTAIQVKQLAAEYLHYALDYYVKHGKQTSQAAHIVHAVKSLMRPPPPARSAHCGPATLTDRPRFGTSAATS
jgi:hypothetical protein